MLSKSHRGRSLSYWIVDLSYIYKGDLPSVCSEDALPPTVLIRYPAMGRTLWGTMQWNHSGVVSKEQWSGWRLQPSLLENAWLLPL